MSDLFVDTFFELPTLGNFAFTTIITIILRKHSAGWVNISLKFRQFQNNLCDFDDKPNTFQCTDQRSDCCILCRTDVEEKSYNGSAQLQTQFFSDAKNQAGFFMGDAKNQAGFFTPKCNIRVNKSMLMIC